MGFIDLSNMPEIQMAEGVKARILTTDVVTVMYANFAEGALIPEHSHHNEQVVNVIEGELELTVDGVKHHLVPGKVMLLKPNVPHSGLALKPTRVIDVFHPFREDLVGSGFSGYQNTDD